jgi:hypothetical protein
MKRFHVTFYNPANAPDSALAPAAWTGEAHSYADAVERAAAERNLEPNTQHAAWVRYAVSPASRVHKYFVSPLHAIVYSVKRATA